MAKGPGKSRAGVHAAAQQQADAFRRKLETAPTVSKASTKSLLPKVDAISLDNLKVEVPAAKPPSDDVVKVMLRALLREKSNRRQRAAGETIAEGDEILIDVLGYRDGKLMPFVGRQNHFVIADSYFDAEGLGQGLIGQSVGGTAVIDAELPQDFAEESLRGFAYKAAVVIRGAVEVMPAAGTADEQLKSLGLGDTLSDVVQKIRQHAFEQAQMAQEIEVHARALQILFNRTDAEIPLLATQEEVRDQWRKSEGALLARQSISQEEMEFSLEAWLATPRILATAESTLRSRVVLDTIARTHQIVALQEEVDAAVAQMQTAMGAKEALSQAALESMSASVRDLKTLAYIAEKAEVVVVDA